jgi:hypothetical protein
MISVGAGLRSEIAFSSAFCGKHKHHHLPCRGNTGLMRAPQLMRASFYCFSQSALLSRD